MTNASLETLYELLDVEPTSTPEEIDAAFFRSRDMFVPEDPELYKNFEAEEAESLLQLLEFAHRTLRTRACRIPNAASKSEENNRLRNIVLGKAHFKYDPQMEREIEAQDVFDGEFLQRVRIYRELSLDLLADATKIGRHYLVAIEANDFDPLPAPVFVRGFIYQIARTLRLDEEKVAKSYMKLFIESRG
jgi:transcriptional regulator with XRE-family HTH domain